MLQGSILQKLKETHQQDQSGKRALNFGVYYKNTLVALCHALEDSILTSKVAPLMITAFQQGKWYLQEADRYGEIAEKAEHVVIMAVPGAGFAEHPTSQRANVDLVNLRPEDPVAQEWHLIIVSPDYTAMVLCQELSEEDYGPTGQPQEDRERKFYGLWTFEPGLVIETAELAIAHLSDYEPELQRTLSVQLQELTDLTKQDEALCGVPTADHLGDIASRVVEYLRMSEEDLDQTSSSTPLNHYTQGLDQNLLSNELQAFLRVAQLIDQTDLSNPMAGAEVAALAEALGQILDLPAWQLHRLRLAGLLHRMGFLQSTDNVIQPHASDRYKEGAPGEPLSCPLVLGTQVLRKTPRLRAIATIVTHQTEWWDGTGQPAGLAGDEIPLESRILGLAAEFQARLASSVQSAPEVEAVEQLQQALAGCQSQQGKRWDPKLVDTLALLVNGLQQGIDLQVAAPKIAAGMWMLDSHTEEDLLANLTASPEANPAQVTTSRPQ